MESLQKEGKMVEVAPGTVQISPERQQLIGVRIGTVEKRRLAKMIRAGGRVDFDEKRLTTISPKVSGWIEELYVDFTGALVKKGAALLTLYSPELVSTQEEYLAARRAAARAFGQPLPGGRRQRQGTGRVRTPKAQALGYQRGAGPVPGAERGGAQNADDHLAL